MVEKTEFDGLSGSGNDGWDWDKGKKWK